MRRTSPGMIAILTYAALVLLGFLIGIAVWGVVLRHAEEHGHNVARPNASAPSVQRGEAGALLEANDGGGLHGFIYARAILSTPLNPVAG